MPFDELEEEELAAMAYHARRLIDGVGCGEEYWHHGAFTIHLRKAISAAELESLSDEWCALAAVDVAGNFPTWTPPDDDR